MILNWAGLIVAFGSILLGNTLEGGHNDKLVQLTAGIIVFGGTLGATMLSCSGGDLMGAINGLKECLAANLTFDSKPIIEQILELAGKARKDGLLSLESSIEGIAHPFLKKNLRSIVDGYDASVLRALMEESIEHEEEKKMGFAKVYETAGGFSPTVGIIGAVLGLIHVMANLSDSSKLGAGIAVAFVATVYGVASANLVFLPLANKIKKYAKQEAEFTSVIFVGLCGIQDGLNPRVIEDKMRNRAGDHGHGGDHGKKAA